MVLRVGIAEVIKAKGILLLTTTPSAGGHGVAYALEYSPEGSDRRSDRSKGGSKWEPRLKGDQMAWAPSGRIWVAELMRSCKHDCRDAHPATAPQRIRAGCTASMPLPGRVPWPFSAIFAGPWLFPWW